MSAAPTVEETGEAGEGSGGKFTLASLDLESDTFTVVNNGPSEQLLDGWTVRSATDDGSTGGVGGAQNLHSSAQLHQRMQSQSLKG